MVDTLNRLAPPLAARQGADAGSSYTASLFAGGLPKIAQKLGEEATETVIAAMQRDPEDVKGEAADLLFHILVLLHAHCGCGFCRPPTRRPPAPPGRRRPNPPPSRSPRPRPPIRRRASRSAAPRP